MSERSCRENREMKARQCAKIREIREALCAAGYVTLNKQADGLGLARSTAWTVLRAGHKASGLTPACPFSQSGGQLLFH